MIGRLLLTRGPAAALLVAGVAACGGGGGGGGVTIPQSDPTPPEITLGAGVQGAPESQSVTVSNGGTPKNLLLAARTGTLNLLATGRDAESGLRDVQIWVSKATTTCIGDTCSGGNFGQVSAPRFSSPQPAKQPGDVVPETSVLADTLDLASEIGAASAPAGGSLTVQLRLYAKAINHLGGSTETARATITWKEP